MSLSPEAIDAMVAAGLSAEQMAAIVKAEIAAAAIKAATLDEERKAKAREGNRERQARWRERRNADNAHNAITWRDDRDPSPKDINQTPTQNLSPTDPDGSVAPKGAAPTRKPRKKALPTDWRPGERSDRVRQEVGRSVQWMHRTGLAMRTWAESKGEIRADWDATHDGWMRREAERENASGGGNPADFVRTLPEAGHGSGTSDLFPRQPARRGHGGSSFDATVAGLAVVAARRGLGPGRGPDGGRSENGQNHRSRPDDPEVEDAEWSPAERYRAAHH